MPNTSSTVLASLLCLSLCAALSPNAPFYSTSVGNFKLTVISDGTSDEFSLEEMVPRIPASAVGLLKEAHGIAGPYKIHFNPLYVDTGLHKVIIDPGSADRFGPGVGNLLENMEKAGLDPMDVDTVLITHAHSDHIPGVMRYDGLRAFPNAKYFVGREEYEFWQNVTMGDKIWNLYEVKESLKPTILSTAQTYLRYVDFNLEKFEFGDEVVPGITAKRLVGHSPGHSGFVIRSRDESFAVLGDSIITEVLQVEHPEWKVAYDMNPTQAVDTRYSILEEYANTGMRVFLFHGNFPGIGRILKGAGSYEFRKAEYEL